MNLTITLTGGQVCALVFAAGFFLILVLLVKEDA